MTSNCWSIISNHSLWYIFYYFHLPFYVSWKDYAVSMKDFVLMDDQCSQAISKQLCLWHLSNAQQIKYSVSSFFLLKYSEARRWLSTKFVNFMSVVSFNFFLDTSQIIEIGWNFLSNIYHILPSMLIQTITWVPKRYMNLVWINTNDFID